MNEASLSGADWMGMVSDIEASGVTLGSVLLESTLCNVPAKIYYLS